MFVEVAGLQLDFLGFLIEYLLVYVEAWVRVDLHKPALGILVDQNVETQYLKAALLALLLTDEASVGIFEVGL